MENGEVERVYFNFFYVSKYRSLSAEAARIPKDLFSPYSYGDRAKKKKPKQDFSQPDWLNLLNPEEREAYDNARYGIGGDGKLPGAPPIPQKRNAHTSANV